jgi:hypothetical protein
MRKTLLALLLCPAFAWAVAGFPGCTYQKTVTYTTAKILEDGTYAAYVDLSELGTTWWSNCSLSTNIVVTNTSNDTSSYLKYVDTFDKSTKTGILWFKLPATTASGGYAVIQTGKTVNVANNKKVFTDLGVFLRSGFEEPSGTISDKSGGYTGSVVAGSFTYGAVGKIGSGIAYASGAPAQISWGDVTQLNSANKLVVSKWIKSSNVYAFGKVPSASNRYAESGNLTLYYVEVCAGASVYGQVLGSSVLSSSAFNFVTVVYDGTQTGNSERLKLFVNGAQVIMTYVGTIPSATPNMAGSPFYVMFGASGTIDEVSVGNTIQTSNYIATDYNLQNHKAVAVYSITDSGSVGGVIYDMPPTRFVELGFYYDGCDSIGTYGGGRKKRSSSVTIGIPSGL